MIDLRSDTATRPTKEMLKAMFELSRDEIGDDVFNEDPTVSALEAKASKMFGKEYGLFCPSGTMTNQVAIKVHTQPGDEIICDASAHIYNYEGGGISFNSSAQTKLILGDRGRISANQVAENINPSFDWLASTSLVSIENTVNRCGGSYYSMEHIIDIAKICKVNNLKFHLDGARIFNALTETKDNPLEVGKHFDSISICLSKGLGAPVGSVLLGDKEFIKKARRIRKVFGGGMRQAGYLAAAGIYALDNNIDRLKDDHKRAKQLGDILRNSPYVENILPVDTNIVIFTLGDTMKSENFVNILMEQNIRAVGFGKQTIRFVTHLDFNDLMLEKVSSVLKKIR